MQTKQGRSMSLGSFTAFLKIVGASWSQDAKVLFLRAREGARPQWLMLQRRLAAQQLQGSVGSIATVVTKRNRTWKATATEVQAVALIMNSQVLFYNLQL